MKFNKVQYNWSKSVLIYMFIRIGKETFEMYAC